MWNIEVTSIILIKVTKVGYKFETGFENGHGEIISIFAIENNWVARKNWCMYSLLNSSAFCRYYFKTSPIKLQYLPDIDQDNTDKQLSDLYLGSCMKYYWNGTNSVHKVWFSNEGLIYILGW